MDMDAADRIRMVNFAHAAILEMVAVAVELAIPVHIALLRAIPGATDELVAACTDGVRGLQVIR